MLRSDPSHHGDSAASVTDGMTVLLFYVASLYIAVRAWRNIREPDERLQYMAFDRNIREPPPTTHG